MKTSTGDMVMETTPWRVVALDTAQLILEGGSPDATIEEVRGYGREAILEVCPVPHFILVTTGDAQDIDHDDLTVFKRGEQLVVTRGLQSMREAFPANAIDDYRFGAQSLLNKKAGFYKADLVKEIAE